MSENPYSNSIKFLEDLIPLSKWVEPSLAILRENMITDSGHDESHLLRVTKNALWFADEEGEYDKDILIPACLLHDLVNLPKDHPNRRLASEMSAVEACSSLSKNSLFKFGEKSIGVYQLR